MTDRFYFSLFLYEAFATFLPYAASDHVVHFLGYGQRLVHQLVGHYHKKGGSQLVAAQLHISFADIALARESELFVLRCAIESSQDFLHLSSRFAQR